MSLVQLAATASPLTDEQVKDEQVNSLNDLASNLSPLQQSWVSGYLAATMPSEQPGVIEFDNTGELTILYGSQTGNAKGIASELESTARTRGLAVRLINMADYKTRELSSDKLLVILVSTYGEGEPPEDAERLYDFLASKKAPELTGTQVSILGLGDSSYELFCQTAIDFEERFTKLGATTLLQRVDLDVDYDEQATGWITKALDAVEPELIAQKAQNNNQASFVADFPNSEASRHYSKKSPFTAEICLQQKITGRDSAKDIRHIEISLADSGISYRAGDALGVYFPNDESLADELLCAVGVSGDESVEINTETISVRQALIEKLEITLPYPAFVKKYYSGTNNKQLGKVCKTKAELKAYLATRQIIDIVREHPARLSAQTLVNCFRKLRPRLYSIASSQAEVEDEVHLTVGLADDGQHHQGSCSGFFSQRINEGDKIRVYVEQKKQFSFPEDPNTPIIMIGPGTGVAPFRAFLQEREAQQAAGDNWLFFGNPQFTQDFLYQLELQKHLKSGLLSTLDVAFSGGQGEKISVQNNLREKGFDVFSWLERGAHIYVCGNANRVTKDVHQALLDIVKQFGGRSNDEAVLYLKQLRKSNRYQKKVY